MIFQKLFPQLAGRKWECVNLDALARIDFPGLGRTREANPLNDPAACARWIDRLHERLGVDFTYGGYLEDRSHLWRGHYQEALGRFIHLGVDYNVPAGTDVFAARRMKVQEVKKDEDQDGGWGGQIIFLLPETDLYVIYAHLEHTDLPAVGRTFEEGEKVGVVGSSSVNGGWFPHLHVQCVAGALPDGVDGYAAPSADLHLRFPNPDAAPLSLRVGTRK
jgi:murein DD-endopeptidase MepM/ murein hydrolase activator NlpD